MLIRMMSPEWPSAGPVPESPTTVRPYCRVPCSLTAYIGDIPLLGVPACGLHHRTTVLDLVLPRLLAGEKIGKKELAFMGHGGLCKDCKECVSSIVHSAKVFNHMALIYALRDMKFNTKQIGQIKAVSISERKG